MNVTRQVSRSASTRAKLIRAARKSFASKGYASVGTEEIVQREIPMRRLGKPNEVADLLFFLCSNQALYLSGSEVHIDGGQRV